MALISHFNIGNYVIGNDNRHVKPIESFDVTSYQVVTRCNNDGFHPNTAPRTEYLEIVLRCDITPMPLYKWYRQNNCQNGCISVDIPDGDRICTRMITFEGGQCFFFNERYSYDNERHQVTLRITVEKLSVDNNLYVRV